MKISKIFLSIVLSIGMVFALASCGSNTAQSDQSGDEQNNASSIPQTDTGKYIDVDIEYSAATSEVTGVESAVEMVYDSVVAIDSYVSSGLSGSGSGVLFAVSEENNLSFIVTCHHVIESCSSFVATLSNGTEYEAKLVGGDQKSDIAVLSIEATDLTYAAWFQDSDSLKLGSTVICIGNPLGTLPGSVSTGVVSYNNREVQVNEYQTMNLIQTDVAINSGNSGGGLFNSAGALIGIVNAKYSSTGIEGLGFAIPSNVARTIIESILNTAQYNESSKMWRTGYVEGEWALESTFSLYRVSMSSMAIAVSSIASNETASDFGKFQVYDRISSIQIKYADESKADSILNNISSVASIYSYIYNSDLQIGDKIIFQIYRGNSTSLQSVEITLSQYRYYI